MLTIDMVEYELLAESTATFNPRSFYRPWYIALNYKIIWTTTDRDFYLSRNTFPLCAPGLSYSY